MANVQWRLSNRGTLLLGVALLCWGGAAGLTRARFIARSVVARGEVAWFTRYRMGVTPTGQSLSVIVRKPFLHWYRRGQSVEVRYDPRHYVPGRIGAYGRINSFYALWLGPATVLLTGLLLTAASIGSMRSSRFRFNVGIDPN